MSSVELRGDDLQRLHSGAQFTRCSSFDNHDTRHSPLAIPHSPLAIPHSPLAIRHSTLDIRHSPFAILSHVRVSRLSLEILK